MSTAETSPGRPKRADARRNYEKILAAAREAFAEGGESTALEEIARRAALYAAGEPLLKRAQEAGAVRPDVAIADVIQMFIGIAKLPGANASQVDHILRVALDGLRYNAS